MNGMLLAGDVGGTKTKLGLFSLDRPSYAPVAQETYRSADFPSLEAMVREFLRVNRASSVTHASFGVAGPVLHGKVTRVNLPWIVEERSLASNLHLSDVHLINDLEAIATQVPFLGPADLATLNPGTADPNGTMAVIAPGTGLGEAFITRDSAGSYRAHPSEGGHSDFAPTTRQQIQLLEHLQEKIGQVSFESVCSGIGIGLIHGFFETIPPKEEASHRKALDVKDPVPPIIDAALQKRCETCEKTIETFVSILGAEAANLTLKVFATGGVFIAGGIPRNILPPLRERAFMESFTRKPAGYAEILSNIPVSVVLNPSTGLLGAARSGVENLRLSPEPRGVLR